MKKDISAASPIFVLPSPISFSIFEALGTGGVGLSEQDVVLCQTMDIAETALRRHASGIAILPLLADEPSTFDAPVEALLARYSNVRWIAVLPPDALAEPAIIRLVTQWCLSWIELPLVSENLMEALSLAHKASVLADGSDGRCGAMQTLVGLSAPMQQLARTIHKVAPVDAPVLIMGESGTGKELVARAIHAASPRADKPFIAVDCGAMPESLVQSKLFGHVKGAFTGATERQVGLIEAAHEGSIFLDDIENLPLSQQVNLLRFLQESTIEPVGSTKVIPVNVRVIAAAHQDLEVLVRAGELREDLFYRLNVLPITLCPLRQRARDIELLAYHHLHQFCEEQGRGRKRFSGSALEAIRAHSWPGNVRELVNRVRRAAVMCESDVIQLEDLGFDDAIQQRNLPLMTLTEARAKAEREVIQQSLKCTGYNISASARLLNISRLSLYRLMDKYCLVRKESGEVTNA